MPDEEDPDRMAAIERIDAALGRIRRSMARQSLGRQVIETLGTDVDSGQFEVLHAIGRQADHGGGVAVGTVAARLGVDPSQASRLVAGAVERGLVVRVAAQADGRRSELRLSDAGEALLARFEVAKRALLGEHFRDWPEADLSDFARLLARFATIARGDGD
jgi:DNA-binding MarR family transcriptional regulator